MLSTPISDLLLMKNTLIPFHFGLDSVLIFNESINIGTDISTMPNGMLLKYWIDQYIEPSDREKITEKFQLLIKQHQLFKMATFINLPFKEPVPVIITASYNANEDQFNGLIMAHYHSSSEVKQLRRQISVYQTLSEVSQSIMDVQDLLQFFNMILDRTLESIFKANIGAILLKDQENVVRMVAWKGYSDEEANTFSFNLAESFSWRETGGNISGPLIVNDLSKYADISMLESKNHKVVYSTISTPIFLEGELYGFINIDSTEKNAYSEHDAEIMVFMKSQIEIAIENQILMNKIRMLSRYDSLTGLCNRRYYSKQLKDLMNSETPIKYGLIIIDLNGLKTINDHYGHITGDRFITKFADHLLEQAKKDHIIARLGGDEFVWVHPYLDKDEVDLSVKQLIQNLAIDQLEEKGDKIMVKFSYGISYYPEESASDSELMKIADQRMYQHKLKFKKL